MVCDTYFVILKIFKNTQEQTVHNAKIYGKNLRKFVRIGIKVALNNLLLSKDTKDILTRKTMASLGFFKQAQFLSANKGQFSCEFLLRMQNRSLLYYFELTSYNQLK